MYVLFIFRCVLFIFRCVHVICVFYCVGQSKVAKELDVNVDFRYRQHGLVRIQGAGGSSLPKYSP